MITLANLEVVLRELHYIRDSRKKIFIKEYPAFDCMIKVDFTTKEITYPQGLDVHRKKICKFSEPENFVVLECITSLLDKGYKPHHIELEKPMPGGHNDTGGYCDILVHDNNGKSFLIIECKKADEFDRFWKKTLVDGDQLFRYYNSYRQAQALCMYTSDLSDEGIIIRTKNIISMVDNEDYLATDKRLKSFKSVRDENGNKEDYFNVWKYTYQQDFSTCGIFEKDIAAYTVGKAKYTIDDLVEVDNNSIQKKYHEFATILRQHNVGSHENAFDKLVNLFLAKIVDEVINPDELQFRWKGAAYDDYYSLQDRLQKLYKEGMEKFLGEEVTYIDQTQVSDAFHLFKTDPDATKRKILEYFRQLKFFTNNDFTFLDVHNEQLFFQNAIILKKVVKMLEDMRLKTDEQNQFLGDLFEGFLDDGVKQSEGQFFTPLPIVKFIVSSLPLEEFVDNDGDIPKTIDYACGAGHFLTEYASCVKDILYKTSGKSADEYYKETYGIEKEYRLSKVAKVSSFMYGESDIQIIHGDALEQNDRIKDNSFSILIANPPYSVKGFLETISEEMRSKYELTKYVSDIARNNSIEVFFVERAKQLLKTNGIAAIILPVSILTNQSIYVACRELIIKYFDIVAISEFGKSTFGKTGTNTVVLFMRRKSNNPDLAEHINNRVNAWFNGDLSKDKVFDDADCIKKYCRSCDIDEREYKTWLHGGAMPMAPIFDSYKNKALQSQKIKHIQNKKISKRYSEDSMKAELSIAITEYIKNLEKEKLFYYMMAMTNSTPIIVTRCPSDAREEKNFLGYEWSGAKGNEGIKYIGMNNEEDALSKNKGINSIKTPLFNPMDYSDDRKINTIIKDAFAGIKREIPEELKKYVASCKLIDMLDFKSTDFNKVINTSIAFEKNDSVDYNCATERLENMLVKISGNTTKIEANEIKDVGKYPVITQSADTVISGYTDSRKPIEDLPLIVFGDHSCTVKYIDYPFVRGADGTQLIKIDESKCRLKYLFRFLEQAKIHNEDKYERHFKYLKKMSIPIPDPDVQDEIIKVCDEIDKQILNNINTIEKNKKKIEGIMNSIEGEGKTIKTLCKKINPSKTEIRGLRLDTKVSFVAMESLSTDGFIQNMVDMELSQLKNGSYTYFGENDIIIAKITPCMENGKCALAKGLTNRIGMGSSEYHVFRPDQKQVIDKFMFYSLNRESVRKAAASKMTGSSGHRRVPITFYENLVIQVPVVEEQIKIADRVEKLHMELIELKKTNNELKNQKKSIIEKYIVL